MKLHTLPDANTHVDFADSTEYVLELTAYEADCMGTILAFAVENTEESGVPTVQGFLDTFRENETLVDYCEKRLATQAMQAYTEAKVYAVVMEAMLAARARNKPACSECGLVH